MRVICLGFIMLLGFNACERAFLKEDPANDPQTNFDMMWETLDKRYSFFSYKQIDWDSVKAALEGRLSPDMADDELFDLLAEMLYALEDGHVNLRSPFDRSRNWRWYLDYPENFNFEVIERNYLREDHRRTGPLLNSFLDSGKVGYIYYGSFASRVSEVHIDYVVNRFKNTDAIIIDIRNNGGGSLSNVDRIASRFADRVRHAYDILYKEGPGHDDFSEAYPYKIFPGGEFQYTKPVYVISNRKSYSSATFFVQSMRVFPHVMIIGDQCGGGGGSPISQELPNGWVYRFSSDMTLSPEGFNIENGVPVDVPLQLDPDSLTIGKDSMIEWVLEKY